MMPFVYPRYSFLLNSVLSIFRSTFIQLFMDELFKAMGSTEPACTPSFISSLYFLVPCPLSPLFILSVQQHCVRVINISLYMELLSSWYSKTKLRQVSKTSLSKSMTSSRSKSLQIQKQISWNAISNGNIVLKGYRVLRSMNTWFI